MSGVKVHPIGPSWALHGPLPVIRDTVLFDVFVYANSIDYTISI